MINPVDIPKGACGIPLNRGRVALIDRGDVHKVAGHRWYFIVHKSGTASIVRRRKQGEEGPRFLRLAREVLDLRCVEGTKVKFANGDPLDNRKENLIVKRPVMRVVPSMKLKDGIDWDRSVPGALLAVFGESGRWRVVKHHRLIKHVDTIVEALVAFREA